jgi:hypothetical protein
MCHELLGVANVDIISMFWDGMMCGTLVHKLSHEPLKTTKELLDVATRHASSEDVVMAAFTLGKMKVAASVCRVAPSRNTTKSIRKCTRSGKKGQKQHPWCIAVVVSPGLGDAL